MAWNFGDSFDLYAAAADATNGYWDSGGGLQFSSDSLAGLPAVSGRAIASSCAVWLTKTSGVNDAVHHFVVAFWQTAAISRLRPWRVS